MLTFDEFGHGDAVVLLHGIPGSRRSWSRVAPLLSHELRVLVPDLLGFGESPEAPREVHAFEQAAAVLAMLDAAGAQSAHVVGFDFGGPVAAAMHIVAPERICRLTFVSTNLLTDTPVPLPLRIARVPLAGDLAFRIFCSRVGLAAMWRMATVDRAAFGFREFSDTIDARGRKTTRKIFLQSLRRLETLYAPIEAELGVIRVPVTVVWGDSDPFFPVVTGQRTATRFNSARFVLLRGCGHFAPHERPKELAAAILERSS